MDTLRKIVFLMAGVVVVMAAGSAARAHWDPGDGHKMHFPQLPDLSTTGLDVMANWPYPFSDPGADPVGKILADDWQCRRTGPVSDIHIWGSWLNDILPQDATGIVDPGNVAFKLSIHADIPDPDGTGPGFSMPGAKLWEDFFTPGSPRWSVREYAIGVNEGFYDPNEDAVIGTDSVVYQYNFFIDPADAFEQQQGTIYWLDVQAEPLDPNAVFGWKTSLDHFNDDAVWGETAEVFGEPAAWHELRYPPGHSLEGESIDLAFVITPEPTSAALMAGGFAALAAFRRVRKRR